MERKVSEVSKKKEIVNCERSQSK